MKMTVEGTVSDLPRESRRRESGGERAIRRALDIAVALPALVLAAPLLLVVAAIIRLDSRGPAIFRQRRIGLNQLPFTVHKFRTMYAEADPAPHRDYIAALVNGNGHRHSDGRQSLFKLAVDDRVTPVGKFLRKTSIDELPQLWDVLRGEMSLVGPRPVVPYELEHYSSQQFKRFTVKPGLTGLWQVSGRNEKTYTEMVELDVEYVERRSLLLDLSILLRTFPVVIERRGVA
jgi:lipopolysaccharide/colanic/teichoic acid biosynthesis glycosyltransferase